MHEVAKAILLERGRLVLQLRDNKPSIETPGVWSLFGGIIEKNEDPKEAMIREIEEELCIKVKDISFLWDLTFYREDGEKILHKIYEADITSLWGKHSLMEGQAVGSFSFDQLKLLRVPPFIQQVVARYQREKIAE
ncbi:MAG: NUDIX domain-containing protein [Nitrospinota bacterium]